MRLRQRLRMQLIWEDKARLLARPRLRRPRRRITRRSARLRTRLTRMMPRRRRGRRSHIRGIRSDWRRWTCDIWKRSEQGVWSFERWNNLFPEAMGTRGDVSRYEPIVNYYFHRSLPSLPLRSFYSLPGAGAGIESNDSHEPGDDSHHSPSLHDWHNAEHRQHANLQVEEPWSTYQLGSTIRNLWRL